MNIIGLLMTLTPQFLMYGRSFFFYTHSPRTTFTRSPVNLMQALIRRELQSPLRCASDVPNVKAELGLLLPAGPGRTWHSAQKKASGRGAAQKKAISFLFNVKSCGFVVLSVDIKAFPLPHYPVTPRLSPSSSTPTPYRPPTGVSPLNPLSHPPIHPRFEVCLPPVCQLEPSFLLRFQTGPESTSLTWPFYLGRQLIKRASQRCVCEM